MNILDLTIDNPFILVALSFVLGIFVSFICKTTSKCTRNMLISLMLLPAIVCVALLAVNGNLGTSIATLGVFSLVRFRSLPGSSRDIINIFYAMTCGLLVSTTYFITAIGLTILIGIFLYIIFKFYKEKKEDKHILKILIPEDVDFDNLFSKVLEENFAEYTLEKVNSSNMGTMFELSYKVVPNKDLQVKKMMDNIRQLNNNLNVSYLVDNTALEEL